MISSHKRNISIDSPDKDAELATNPCSSDRNCINKGALGKFFRKQDFGKIERKKKSDQEKSLMCYLTPKNCEDSTKAIKEKFGQHSVDLSINNFLSQSSVNIHSKQQVSKPQVNMSLVQQPTARLISMQKGRKQTDRKMRVSFKGNCGNQIKQGGITPREGLSKLKGTSSFRNLKQSDVKRQDQQAMQLSKIPSCKSIPAIYDKEMKRMKMQCEQYSQQLQVCHKEKQQFLNQMKSLNVLVQQLKQRNANLLSSQGDLEKDILQLNSQLSSLTNENRELKQEIKHINDEKAKYIEEISYLKQSVADLDERIDIMLQATPSSTPRNNKNLTSSANLSPMHNGKRINSMCFVKNKGRQSSSDDSTHEDLKLLVHQLQQQLKYSQVEVNMLKRVKMDINKRNQEFIKLQRQNQILKNQIFDMKMNNAFEQQGRNKNVKSHIRNKSGFSPSGAIKNNLQINNQKSNGAKDNGVINKAKDFDNVSESSDTLSLNLSLSPSQKFRY